MYSVWYELNFNLTGCDWEVCDDSRGGACCDRGGQVWSPCVCHQWVKKYTNYVVPQPRYKMLGWIDTAQWYKSPTAPVLLAEIPCKILTLCLSLQTWMPTALVAMPCSWSASSRRTKRRGTHWLANYTWSTWQAQRRWTRLMHRGLPWMRQKPSTSHCLLLAMWSQLSLKAM